MTHKLKLSKHVHSFIHLLRSNLFTELRQNSSVQNAFLKRNASKAFHIYTGRKYRETNKSHLGEFRFSFNDKNCTVYYFETVVADINI